MTWKISMAAMVSVAAVLATSPALGSRYSEAVLASGPVAYYRLGETSGSVAANSSTNGVALDGDYTNFGTTTPPSTIGAVGPRPGDPSGTSTIRGLESDNSAIQSAPNSNVQVVVPDNNLLDITGALTLEAWVYRDAQTNATNNEGIVGKFVGNTGGVAESNRSYVLYYDPRTTTPAVSMVVNTTGINTGNFEFRTTTDIPLGSTGGWTYLAAVYEPNVRMAIYLNGVSIGEKTTGLPAVDLFNSTAPLWIGRQFRNDVTNTSFEGRIDEVAVYNTALSAATILAHYQAATLVPGDFDGDGDVDGADFVAWQTNFPTANGATLAEGDADGDGDVDGADFVIWQTNFPFTPGPGVSSIPEPVSFLLACLGIAVLGLRRRNRI